MPLPLPLRDGLLLAVGTYSAVPVPPPRRVDRDVARVSLVLAPLVGAGLGAVAGLAAVAAHTLHVTALGCGLLGVAVLLLATRAFHADGLADTVDGLSSSYDPQRALAVMKTGDVGPAGAAALVVVLGLQAASMGAVAGRGLAGVAAVSLACAAGRAGLAIACRRGVPSARPGGLGDLVAGVLPTPLAATVPVLCAAPGLALGIGGPIAVLAALAAAGILTRRAHRRVGGITGDVLGAVVEVGTAAALVVLGTAA